MQVSTVSVSAPSRLHFGLLSIGDRTRRRFGGAGLMIAGPRTHVVVKPNDRFALQAATEITETVHACLRHWQASFAPQGVRHLSIDEFPVELTVDSPPRHSGLGTGTQLAFAIATAMQLAFEQPVLSSEDLALGMKRGKRSAIGSYGFHQGGFLVDRGIVAEPIAPLDMRVDFPENWHVVLLKPQARNGDSVCGEAEIKAFRNLPATTQAEADGLSSLLRDHIVPAVLEEDFSRFASSVTEYGYRSGMFYSPIQGGAYATPEAAKIVDTIGSLGEFAVGQSSWGPTIFAIAPAEKEAWRLVDKLGEHGEDVPCHATVVAPDNFGMRTQNH